MAAADFSETLLPTYVPNYTALYPRMIVFVTSSRIVNRKYLFAPWSRVLLEKLTGSKLVKKFPTFHGTRRFITAFTISRHLSLS